MSKYPKIGDADKMHNHLHYKGRKKCPCGNESKFKVTIQWNYSRGDDEITWRCEEHKKELAKLERVGEQK